MNIDPNQPLSGEQLKELVAHIFSEKLPFNKVIGMKIGRYDDQQVDIHFPLKPKLIGNPAQNILHGGVTATALDTVGGLLASRMLFANVDSITFDEFKEKMYKGGTIDLRVDYLRPGRGEEFIASATLMRKGSKIAVCRMELHNEKGDQIAFGTGTYLVG